MIWFRLAALAGTASLCFGCWPIPKVDQDDYCFADVAFTAEITERNISEYEIEYAYSVKKSYKGNSMNRKLLGHGTSNSCGPQELQLNTQYLIYAKTDAYTNNLLLVAYKAMDYVTDDDIRRMETYYDCGCKINYDYDAFAGLPSMGLPEPPATECNAPTTFCPRSGFCKKSIEGICTWGDLGNCN